MPGAADAAAASQHAAFFFPSDAGLLGLWQFAGPACCHKAAGLSRGAGPGARRRGGPWDVRRGWRWEDSWPQLAKGNDLSSQLQVPRDGEEWSLDKAWASVHADPPAVGRRTPQGRPLAVAVRRGRRELAELLRRSGAILTCREADSLLHEAAGEGNAAAVEVLLCDGRGAIRDSPWADPNAILSGCEETALDAAVAGGHDGCAEVLRRAGGRHSPDRLTAILRAAGLAPEKLSTPFSTPSTQCPSSDESSLEDAPSLELSDAEEAPAAGAAEDSPRATGMHPGAPGDDALAPGEAPAATHNEGGEAHELGGQSEDGGLGGPLCQDPYGEEVRGVTESLLAQARRDSTLPFNNFTDPRPELTREQVAMIRGFDRGDETLELPCGPLPWPAGLPEPGYTPKANPLHGCWISVCGGQAGFVREAIEMGAVGAAEAEKTVADSDRETGAVYLRISQFRDVCTVDASVAEFARATRTWKSGRYFLEPLVSGGDLLGLWVLPEEYRTIGIFWEMESGHCFRIERRIFPAGPYTFLRQATEISGKVSFIFYVKVSNDPGFKPIPLQSRDDTALAGVDHAPDNLGKPYRTAARDLDSPNRRDAWPDADKDAVSTAFDEDCERGFEVGEDASGGALSSTQPLKSGDAFSNDLHRPVFHARGPRTAAASSSSATPPA